MSSFREAMMSVPKNGEGNTSWAQHYGRELRGIVTDYAARAPRSVQKHLGPSELGEACDRQVVFKMARAGMEDKFPKTNHVSDPWASIMGTAGHAYVEDVFKWDNERREIRWLAENRVCPDPDPSTGAPGVDSHPGTADLYDSRYAALVDHKFLGDTSRQKLIAHGPKRVYYVQLLLYRRGFQQLGLPVERVVLVAWPRTKSSMADLYVWEHTPTTDDERLVGDVLAQTKERQTIADLVRAGAIDIMDVKATPSDDSCMFCPLYRPQSAYQPNSYGCPGTLLKK